MVSDMLWLLHNFKKKFLVSWGRGFQLLTCPFLKSVLLIGWYMWTDRKREIITNAIFAETNRHVQRYAAMWQQIALVFYYKIFVLAINLQHTYNLFCRKDPTRYCQCRSCMKILIYLSQDEIVLKMKWIMRNEFSFGIQIQHLKVTSQNAKV